MFRCGGNISNKIDNVSEYPKTEKLRIEITSFTVVILIQPVLVKLRKYTWHQADTQVISLFISNLSLNIYFCFSGLGGWLRLTLDTTSNHKFLQNPRPVHRHPDIFESATFSFWIHNISSSTRSKNIRNRCQIDPSPKWRPKIQIS